MFDDDLEAIISRLSGPLSPEACSAFRRAAESVAAQIECSGPGNLYRTISALQSRYFTPPPDNHVHGGWHSRRSKLRDEPAIEHDSDGRHTRYSKLRVVA
jgi:hypothetical protein